MLNRKGLKVLSRQPILKQLYYCHNRYKSNRIKFNSPVHSVVPSEYSYQTKKLNKQNGAFQDSTELTSSNLNISDPLSEYSDLDLKEQVKKANLGSMTDELRALIPNILNKSLPKSIISRDIHLRICPTHFQEFNAYFPTLKGHVSYYTTCKTLQFILTSIVLNPKVKLHIQSVKTNRNSGDLFPGLQSDCPSSTKIYVRWNTCMEGCFHLSPTDINGNEESNDTSNYYSTSDAKLGSHKWAKFDTKKLVDNPTSSSPASPSVTTTLTHLTTGLIGLTKEHKRLERVISGIFIFELNESNDKVLVHTIEDVNVIEKTETQDIDGELRVC